MLQPGWKLEKHRIDKGFGEGSFTTFNLTSPEGIKYSFHNSSNRNPRYYINVSPGGVSDVFIGNNLQEAIQNIYKRDEEKMYIPVKEWSDEPIYKVIGNNYKDTFCVEELDPNTIIVKDAKLMQEYAETGTKAVVFCTKDTLPEAKQMIADIVINGKIRFFNDEIARITRQKEELTNKIEAFLSETPVSLEEDEDMER